ncbi:MAG: SCO family protein [Alphaproteobacteria bacterium]
MTEHRARRWLSAALPPAIFGVFVAAAVNVPAAAHSVGELQDMLGSREQYFQALDATTPDFDLLNAAGGRVALGDLRGQVVVLFFIYTHCPDVCPLHADRIALVQEKVNRTPMREAVRFVAITTDPLRDTPDVLSAYGEDHGFDPANWLFLTVRPGEAEDATRRLAEQFGHRFDRSADGSYQTHGIVTHIIDKYGRWRANFHGLRFEPTNMVLFLNALVNDSHTDAGTRGSIWNRFRDLFR